MAATMPTEPSVDSMALACGRQAAAPFGADIDLPTCVIGLGQAGAARSPRWVRAGRGEDYRAAGPAGTGRAGPSDPARSGAAPGWPRSARALSLDTAEAELAHAAHVVLDPGGRDELPVAHPEDVDLVDILEPLTRRRPAHPLPQLGARAAEMRGHLLLLGDQVDDLHPEVGE